MIFPTFEQVLLSLLVITRDVTKQSKDSYNTERAIRNLAKQFDLTSEEREMEFAGGKVFRDLVTSARDHLMGAKLLEGANRNFEITANGKSLLRKKVTVVDEKMLQEYPNYKIYLKAVVDYSKSNAQWYKENQIMTPTNKLIALKKFVNDYNFKSKTVTNISKPDVKSVQLNIRYSLEEEINRLHQEHNAKLKEDLLVKVKAMSPALFEELSVAVLAKLIFTEIKSSSSPELKNIAKAVGRSGDGGIDGIIIKNDKIRGETKYYVQAKRWNKTTIGEPEIRNFVGALVKQRAKVGIFITTSSYTKAAEEYATDLDKIELKLIDGDEFMQHMIDNEVGVQKLSKYELNAVDQEFFSSKSLQKATLF